MTNENTQEDVQQKPLRRRFLLSAGLLLGALWTAAISAPFLAGLRPSRKTQAAGAPVAVDIAAMREGELKVVVWRLKPVWVLRRSIVANSRQSAKRRRKRRIDKSRFGNPPSHGNQQLRITKRHGARDDAPAI